MIFNFLVFFQFLYMILLVFTYGGLKANSKSKLADFFGYDCYGRNILSREKGAQRNIGDTDKGFVSKIWINE